LHTILFLFTSRYIFIDVSIGEAEVITEMLSYLTLYPSLVSLAGDVIATLAREGKYVNFLTLNVILTFDMTMFFKLNYGL